MSGLHAAPPARTAQDRQVECPYRRVDSGDGTLASISDFEDRAGAEKSNKLAEHWVGRSLSSALPTSPETIVGEVGAHELNLIKHGIREILE